MKDVGVLEERLLENVILVEEKDLFLKMNCLTFGSLEEPL